MKEENALEQKQDHCVQGHKAGRMVCAVKQGMWLVQILWGHIQLKLFDLI